MFSPLLESIIEREKIVVVNESTVDEFALQNGDVVLFFSGDHKRLVEVNDVAVILPELIKASDNTLVATVVDRDSERPLQRRYRFNSFPTLVFLRKGQYLGAISRVLDWADYIAEINEILSSQPSQPPAFKLPDGCGTPASTISQTTTEKLIEKGAENV